MPNLRARRQLIMRRVAPIVAAPSFSLTNVSSNQDSSGASNPLTFTAQSLGAASANRRIAVAMWTRTADTSAITITVGGVPTTLVNATPSSGNIQTNTAMSGIWLTTSDPSGTTGDVRISSAGTIFRAVIAVYRLITTTPTATASDNNFNASTGSAFGISGTSIVVPASGGGIFAFFERNETADSTLSANVTKDVGLAMSVGNLTIGRFNATGSQTPTGTASAADEVYVASAVWQA